MQSGVDSLGPSDEDFVDVLYADGQENDTPHRAFRVVGEEGLPLDIPPVGHVSLGTVQSSLAPASVSEASSRIQQLEAELAASRQEAESLHQMLEELPVIYEEKFRQRLTHLQDQQRLLLADNEVLRNQLVARALPPAGQTGGAAASPALMLHPAAVVAEAHRPGTPMDVVCGVRGVLRKVLGADPL